MQRQQLELRGVERVQMKSAADLEINSRRRVPFERDTNTFYGRKSRLPRRIRGEQELHGIVKVFMQQIEPEFNVPCRREILLPRDRFEVLVGFLPDPAVEQVDL